VQCPAYAAHSPLQTGKEFVQITCENLAEVAESQFAEDQTEFPVGISKFSTRRDAFDGSQSVGCGT
jgi:hypothetical protein